MDVQARKSALMQQLMRVRQAIAEASVTASRIEGAIAMCDELLKEGEDGVDTKDAAEPGSDDSVSS